MWVICPTNQLSYNFIILQVTKVKEPGGSYVTGDKIYCIYIAPNKEMVPEHAKQGGFPANEMNEVMTIIDPSTAD
ncbi:MAG: DUF4242 domain-containing protein [Chitinophagaceae bacterium]|nr:DUF4242 domain-containing protein [Chitinophagaceae bacterium]